MTDPGTAELGAAAIEQAGRLVELWLDSIGDRGDQIAGRILYDATRGLASMRTYCNQARLIHVPLQGFSREWPQERRDQLRDAWTDWQTIYDIFPTLEDVTDTLYLREVRLPTRWWHGRTDQRTVAALETELAGILAMFLNDVAYEIKHSKLYIRPSAFDSGGPIRDFSNFVLGLVEDPGEELVARARTTVMRLRETVLRQRAGLPQEVWQQLDALALGGWVPGR